MTQETIIVLISQALFNIALFIAFIWLMRAVIKRVRKIFVDSKISAVSQVLGLGVSLLFFSKTFERTIFLIGRFFLDPLRRLSSIADYSVYNGVSEIRNYKFNEWTHLLYDSFINNIFQISFSSLTIFITLWILFAIILESIRTDSSSSAAINFNDRNIGVKNALIISLIIFSLYLSVAAIVAIPEFQNLENASITKEAFEDFEKNIDNQIIVTEPELLINHNDTISPPKQPAIKSITNQLRTILDDYNALVEKKFNTLQYYKQTATNNFNAALEGKISNREKVKYKLLLIEWFQPFAQDLTDYSSVQSNLEGAISDIEEVRIRYLNTPSQDSIIQIESEKQRTNLEELAIELTYLRTSTFSIQNRNTRPPKKPQIGEQYGIFNRMSGWLLKTESLSLALIVGLFAFGLLGALASTFIREKLGIRRKKLDKSIGHPLIADLPGVLINGMSAAIIVFLGIKGAVIVFTGADEELNPYMLFFTCIVAAVFSEDAWEEARRRFNNGADNIDNT